MPVGFENSALKMSFSLSSLQPSSASLESPEHARLRSERPYNSLTKKPRKDPEQETWRRSWGSRDDKEEFWAALQPNYTYLMDNHLIDSCQEAWDEASYDWSYNEFTCQFAELYAWLNGIQEGVYGKEENVTDRGLRLSHVEEMQRNAYRRKVFNERSASLLERSPQLSEEVTWRVSHLNSKWEMLEQTLTTPVKVNPDQEDVCTDVEHEVRCLRKWLSEMETRLQPLDFRTRWSPQELEEKAREHVVLQRDVESHGKIVCSVVKLCERISQHSDARTRRRYDTTDAARVAQRLESRWHHLYLRSLEWTYYIETLVADKLGNNSPVSVGASESDEEPVSKYPRLCQTATPLERRPLSEDGEDDGGDACSLMDTSPPLEASDPERTMVGSKRRNVVSREEIQALEERVAASLPATPHRLVIGNPKGEEVECGILSTTRWAVGSGFHRSNRDAPNYATFYFKHLDTDSEQDARNTEVAASALERSPSGGSGNEKSQEDSSEEEWTFTCGNEPNGKAENETSSSSETTTSLRQHSRNGKKGSFVVRLDFSANETLEMGVEDKLVYENNQNVNGIEANGHQNGVYKNVDKMCARRNSRESIQRLVIQAEEMVASPDKMAAAIRAARVFEPLVFGEEKLSSSHTKHTRIKEWLQVHLQNDDRSTLPPVDSCDASGEYTTGDSDEEKESQSSEDFNGSVATCRQVEILLGCARSDSADALADADVTTPQGDKTSPLRTPSHVVMRSKRRQACDRPWSVSGVPQGLVDTTPQTCDPLSHFSISESALNQIATTTSPQKGPLSGSGVINVSSSTIDGSPMMAGETAVGFRCESLRRRKLRTRKRITGRKSDSGSEGVTAGHSNSGGSDTAQQQQQYRLKPHSRSSSGVEGSPRHIIAKSGSFSGTNSPRKVSDRSTNSDPVAMLKDEMSTSSSDSGEDERDSRQRLVPSFKLGPEGGPVSSFLSPADKNLALGVEEHHSSLSEQAWDNYQEKYMSEPYSEELADSEAARRLLEFGDDYRNFIDSQSDCASSLSANQMPSPVRRRRSAGAGGECHLLDSDSDLEDIKHLMQQSRSQLVFSEHVFSKQLAKASPELVLATDFAEIGATCRENILCLRTILENVEEDEGGLLSAHECKDIRGLVERWDMLQGRTEDLQRVRALQREMASLKDELLDLASRVGGMEANLENRDQLENHINQVKTELTSLRDRKTKLLDVNVAVHRFLTDTGHPAAVLKDDVADLYRVWDETFQSVSQRLGTLQKVSTAWQQFDTHLIELQVALRADQDTLRMLDTALQGGDVTSDVASSVRDVAKVLSEKQEQYQALCQKPSLLNDSTTATNDTSLSSPRSNEGSLSDSGISDEGSEQELSERERRLESLRRLARHLEGVLAPGSQVLINMAKRIEATENELRGLQRTCRDLIVRTAVCVEARTSAAPPLNLVTPPQGRDKPLRPKPTPRARKMSSSRKGRMVKLCSADPDDSDPDKRRSWLWRVMRAALPFQMALVALFCVACLLEPHCCDAMNNLNLSLTPQLRYLRGPPPI